LPKMEGGFCAPVLHHGGGSKAAVERGEGKGFPFEKKAGPRSTMETRENDGKSGC
jgi:hypothetical protein